MINKVSTRIQSRLSRKNIKVSLSEIKQIYSQMVTDADKPTDDEINAVTDYFINQFSKPTPVTQEETESNPQISATDIIETDSVLEEPEYEPPIASQQETQLVVSSADKQALVSTQSAALGFELSEQEAADIADMIDDVFADYSSFVINVTSAIKSYIAHKFDAIENELDSSSNDVRQYLADRNSRLNQKLADYADNVKGIKSDTQAIRQNLDNFKSAVLSRFRVGLLKKE